MQVWGRRFPSRFGLAAGFDKNAVGVAGLTMLGFGFVEVGTVTAHAQPGNEPPRLWRVLDQRALRNRMGFNNEGSAAVAARLRRLRATPAGRRLVVGVNIGKTKVTPAEQAPADYATSAGRLAPYADYLVVNVSSPNTPGLRDLQSVEALRPILEATRVAADEATARRPGSPRCRCWSRSPRTCPTTTSTRWPSSPPSWGWTGSSRSTRPSATTSGPAGCPARRVLARGLDVVARLRNRLGPDAVIIGVGGITTAADAREYVAVGATLVQGYTGLIYEGPAYASRIARALAADEALRGPARRKAVA